MRTRSRTLTAVALGALLVAGGSLAQADDVSNDLDHSIDAVAELMTLNVGGPDGTTQLYVQPRNEDGKQGCNLTGGTALVLAVASSDPTVAKVSPPTVTFTSCGTQNLLNVTPVAVGSTTISATQVSNSTGGTFNLAPVTFTVDVAAPANTAPTINISGVTGGASYDKGSVPVATCEVTDAEDGNSSFAATLSPVTGPDALDEIGSQEASCSYTDKGGLTASASVTYSIVDPSAPAIGYTLSPADPDGDNGWYTSDVTLSWTVTEDESPSSLVKIGCVDQSITADQEEQIYSCSASSAGGDAGPIDVKIKRDATAPVVGYTTASGTVGLNGWYTSPVTATFTGTDAMSGPATATGTATSGDDVEGAAVQINSPAFSDNAGNVAPTGAASQTFKIDLTDPVATFDSTISDVYYGSVPAAPTCTASDDVSGPADCVVTGYSTAVGTHTLIAKATDEAGRTGVAEQQYTVMPWTAKGFYQPVDMGGVLNTVKGGSTVPLKFELFAGATELTDPALVSFAAKGIICSASEATDEIEMVTTGATSLRYDASGGQFIYNWKTPTGTGKCYQVTMSAADGTTLSAKFKLK